MHIRWRVIQRLYIACDERFEQLPAYTSICRKVIGNQGFHLWSSTWCFLDFNLDLRYTPALSEIAYTFPHIAHSSWPLVQRVFASRVGLSYSVRWDGDSGVTNRVCGSHFLQEIVPKQESQRQNFCSVQDNQQASQFATAVSKQRKNYQTCHITTKFLKNFELHQHFTYTVALSYSTRASCVTSCVQSHGWLGTQTVRCKRRNLK